MMLKIYTTGPIVNSNEAATPAPISNKFKLVFDPIQNNRRHSDCCPCYVVATLYKADPTTLAKTVVSTQTAVLSDTNYTVIEFTGLLPLIYEIEIKVFCPGIIPIVNIYGQRLDGGAYSLVPCHCFKFKELVVKEIKCDCDDHDSDEDDEEEEDDEKPCHKESCERPIRKKNRC